MSLDDLTARDWDRICDRFKPIVSIAPGKDMACLPCNLIIKRTGEVVGIGPPSGLEEYDEWRKWAVGALDFLKRAKP
jgi:hypothetical protein